MTMVFFVCMVVESTLKLRALYKSVCFLLQAAQKGAARKSWGWSLFSLMQ